MASTIDTSPESIQEFRFKIQDRIEELKEQLKSTESAIETVHKDWDDEVFRNFIDGFSKDKDEITKLCEVLSEYEENILAPFQQKLENYLG
jgi:uncharacterized protein YukE